jgi:hypothetical protein
MELLPSLVGRSGAVAWAVMIGTSVPTSMLAVSPLFTIRRGVERIDTRLSLANRLTTARTCPDPDRARQTSPPASGALPPRAVTGPVMPPIPTFRRAHSMPWLRSSVRVTSATVTSITTCLAGWSRRARTSRIARQRWGSPWNTMTLRTGSTATCPSSPLKLVAWRRVLRPVPPAREPAPGSCRWSPWPAFAAGARLLPVPPPPPLAPTSVCSTGSRVSTVVWRAE